ncbi:CDP-glycerol glycerophosphotransferase family protein [Natrarchaeobius oligotrophus]|uniref:CDP-glycerol glycerophosphotransferase family protein n=1 Tax=Natrarchaeobius oligotrophus TaxID=3455743 RepID=UPI001404EC0E|nr:CDP-glycerol glycerophosphotransferase family protein [Natrarchaeobius chitinivorans]
MKLLDRSQKIYDAVAFRVQETRQSGPRNDTIAVTLRESTLDADTLSLVLLAENHPAITTVYLVVESLDRFHQTHEELVSQLDLLNLNIEAVSYRSELLQTALIESWITFIRNSRDLLYHRFLNSDPKRNFVQIYHGLAKGSGNLRRDSQEKQREKRLNSLSYQKPFLSRISTAVDLYTVSTDIERFYRSAADGIQPALIQKCGYPKYDRLYELIDSEGAKPIVPKETQRTLEADDVQYRILYAPTHRGSYGLTKLFPFDDFDIKTLRAELASWNAELYIRTHISEERAGTYDDVVDGSVIKYAGHSFSPSSTEILPYFDVLVTDYSSIYTEYLPLDRPIIFVKDTGTDYFRSKGLALDYGTYFPGPKVDRLNDLTTELELSLNDNQYYADDREFVAKALLPDPDQQFLASVMQNLSQ